MVIVSNEIENVLLDIYSREFAYNVHTPNYFTLKQKLFALDKRYVNRVLGRYPAWKKMGWLEVVYKQHIFGYSWDGENVVIHEHYILKSNKNENNNLHYNLLESRNNNHVIRLTEKEFKQMIVECISNILKEIA